MGLLERRLEKLEQQHCRRPTARPVDLHNHAYCAWSLLRGMVGDPDAERLAAMESAKATHPDICGKIELSLNEMLAYS
jgi:hypothetical protein